MRRLVIVLAGALIVSGIAWGAGSTQDRGTTPDVGFNPTGYPVVDQEITLRVVGARNPLHANWRDMSSFQHLQKLTNINLEFELTDQSSFIERRNILFASGDLPDLLIKAALSPIDEQNYFAEGQIISLNDLIDRYAPNINAILSMNDDEARRAVTLPSGDIVGLPRVNITIQRGTGHAFINKGWLDQLGMSVPENMDELEAVLVAFKTQDPNGSGQTDEIPWIVFNQTHFDYFLASWGVLFSGEGVFLTENGDVEYTWATEGYRQALLRFSDWFARGLIDPEAFTQSGPQATAKGTEEFERLGLFIHAAAFLAVGQERDANYVVMPPMKNEFGGERTWVQFPHINRGTGAITSANRYPEATIRLMDYFYDTVEGALTMDRGVIGVDSDIRTYDGRQYFVQLARDGETPSEARGRASAGPGWPLPGVFGPYLEGSPDDEIIWRLYQEREKTWQYMRPAFPLVYMDPDTAQRANSLRADLDSYVQQMKARFIVGDVDVVTGWDGYIQTLQRMGLEEYVEIYSAAYQATK